jgi:hypothetical protein
MTERSLPLLKLITVSLLVLPSVCGQIAFPNASPQPGDALPEPNSNRIVWREGAQGSATFVSGMTEEKTLRYRDKLVQANLQLWGAKLLRAYVGVKNVTANDCVIDSTNDISVQMTLPRKDVLTPLELAQVIRLLGKKNKDTAKVLQKYPYKLGPIVINGNSFWDRYFYFSLRREFDEELLRLVPHVDLQVYIDGMAFVFPFKL